MLIKPSLRRRTSALCATFAVATGLLSGVSCAAADTPPPSALQRYIVSGHFDPGDYSWMKGRFADASASEAATWKLISDWRRQCMEADRQAVARDFIAAGVSDPQVPDGFYGDTICAEVSLAIPDVPEDRFAQFQSYVTPSKFVAASIIWAATAAQQTELDEKTQLQDQLRARTLIDQILRRAAMSSNFEGPTLSTLSAAEMAVIRCRIWLAISRTDRDNTSWFKSTIEQHGWIGEKTYGKDASGAAWLLVQHADHDPIFQYRILRDLDPSRPHSEPEITGSRYALLWDRVMLKIKGKQTYGTQLICKENKWEPLPIEDPAHIDARRSQKGLGPLSEYIARMAREITSC